MIVRGINIGPKEIGYLLGAIWYLACARIRFQFLNSRDLVNRLDLNRFSTVPSSGPVRKFDAAKMFWALAAAGSRLPWRGDCIVQSLAAQAWLSRQGIRSKARIGLKLDEKGQIRAHSWVEFDGPFDGCSQSSGFTVLDKPGASVS